MYGTKRLINENTDRIYWENKYNELKQKLMNGEIKMLLGDGTSIASFPFRFVKDARPDVAPALGMGDYGEWIDNDKLEDKRPVD